MALEEFTSAGSRDFRQRYLDVFGYFPTERGDVLVRVNHVDDAKTTFVDAKGLSYTAYADKGVVFRFIPITKRLFFYKKNLCLAHRKPARQYQRGITYNNTTMQTMFGDALTVDFDTIEAYSNNRDPDTDKGDLLINNMLAIYSNSVYLYNLNIGAVLQSSKRIVLHTKLFRQELTDSLRDNGLNYEVVL